MKLAFILLLGFSFLFSINSFAKNIKPFPKKSSAQIKAIKQKLKQPEVALKMMSRLKNQWSLLKIMQKHMTSEDFKYLKTQGNLLHIKYKKPLNLKILGKNKFRFSNHSDFFILSSSGKYLKFKKMIFQLSANKSLIWNYKNILSKLAQKKYGKFSFFPKAYAEEASTGYDITVLLYYMKVYYDGEGIMWDFFTDEPDVITAIESLNKQGKTISSIRCDDIGMVMQYDDGSVSYITWSNDNEGLAIAALHESQGANSSGRVVNLDEMGQALAGEAEIYYCSMLQSKGQSEVISLINLNFIKSNPQETHVSQ